MNNPTIREAYNLLNKRFELACSDAPRLCARVLLSHVLTVDNVYLSTHALESIDDTQWQELDALAKRHECGEPLAYIVGYKEFYGRKFLLNSHTLIPRPETEDVLEAALAATAVANAYFLDIGTGSGCLGLSFAAERLDASGILLDIQPKALSMAHKNAKNLGVLERIKLINADLQNLPFANESFDLIVSNPPYVSEGEYKELLPNVRDFEPKIALVPSVMPHESDELGLAHIKSIAHFAPMLLKAGGVCIVEHGQSQACAVRNIFNANKNWSSVETRKDLSLLERFCVCKKS